MAKKKLSDDDVLRDKIISSIIRMKKAHLGMLVNGISYMEFLTLEILARFIEEYPDKTGMGVSELAEKIHISMPQMSRLLKNMEEKQYILRIVNATDRRNTYVSITDIGGLKRKCVKGEMDDYINTVIARMGADKIDLLIELVNESVDIMKDEQNKRKEHKH